MGNSISSGSFVRSWGAVAALLVIAISLVGCHRKSSGAEAAPGQKTFGSPEEAGRTLAQAANSDDQSGLAALFGPESRTVLYSGDAGEDKAALAAFAADYDRMNRWRKLDDTRQVLLVGPANVAFPVPVRQDSSGRWYFDTAAGRDELLARRIGRNELAIIDVCAALAEAQQEYFAGAHSGVSEYARKFISDTGKQDGLYWASPPGKAKSPLGPAVAFATEEGKKDPQLHKPFHGYYFGMLTTQGNNAKGGLRDYARGGISNRGFGFVAYPAEYGKSGLMTFIIDREGVVYQKDLGPTTVDQASLMNQFNPDTSWSEVKQ